MEYWLHKVDDYLHQLENDASDTTNAIVALEHVTRLAQPEAIEMETHKLQKLVAQLQGRLADRKSLLAGFYKPGPAPESLQSALSQTDHPLAKSLLQRSIRIAEDIEFINRKAIGVFVGQIHLVGVTEEFLRLLSGQTAQPITYDQQTETSHGSVIDKAA